MSIRIFCDGACSNNGGDNQNAGIGIVVEWQGKKPLIISKNIGNKTNNEAEYSALIESLLIIRDEQIMDCVIHSDSNLMVKQVNNEWQCKDFKLKQLLFIAQKRIKWLKERGYKIELIYIPRELNLADIPAKNGKEKPLE